MKWHCNRYVKTARTVGIDERTDAYLWVSFARALKLHLEKRNVPGRQVGEKPPIYVVHGYKSFVRENEFRTADGRLASFSSSTSSTSSSKLVCIRELAMDSTVKPKSFSPPLKNDRNPDFSRKIYTIEMKAQKDHYLLNVLKLNTSAHVSVNDS